MKQISTDACVSALKAEVAELKATVAALAERLEDVELTYTPNGKKTPRQIARLNAESAAEAGRMREYRERQERENEAQRADHEKRKAAAASEEEQREREADNRRAQNPTTGVSGRFVRSSPFADTAGKRPFEYQHKD